MTEQREHGGPEATIKIRIPKQRRTNSESPTAGERARTAAPGAGGRDSEPPPARPKKIKIKSGQQAKQSPISAEEWITRHLALAPRISDERWARIDAVFAVMEDQQRSESVRSPRREPE